jgi:transcriptional regulator with XRE-family HTH domain
MAGRKSDGLAADLREQLRRAVVHKVDTWNVAQSEAARRLGTDRVALNRMLLGKRTPSIEALLSFADAADMTLRYIIEDRSSEPMQMSSNGLSAPDDVCPVRSSATHSLCGSEVRLIDP